MRTSDEQKRSEHCALFCFHTSHFISLERPPVFATGLGLSSLVFVPWNYFICWLYLDCGEAWFRLLLISNWDLWQFFQCSLPMFAIFCITWPEKKTVCFCSLYIIRFWLNVYQNTECNVTGVIFLNVNYFKHEFSRIYANQVSCITIPITVWHKGSMLFSQY